MEMKLAHQVTRETPTQRRFIMRYFIAAAVLAFALVSGSVAFAADGWGTHENGYGRYHESNG
jgi:hypothetical protein